MDPTYEDYEEDRRLYQTFEEQQAELQEVLRSLPVGEKLILGGSDEEGNCIAR